MNAKFFSWKASAKTLGGVLLIIVALLFPPAWIPALVAITAVCMFLAASQPRQAFFLWLMLMAILLIKNVWFPWYEWLLIVALLLFSVPRKQFPWIALMPIGLLGLTVVVRELGIRPLLPERETLGDNYGLIVSVGDSLTSFTPEGRWRRPQGYPEVLAKKLRMPVINRGQSGANLRTIRTGFEKEVLALKPRIVIFEIGGHDQLGGATRQQVYDGLAELVRLSQEKGAFVMIWEIPGGLVRDPMRGVYRQLAHDLQTGLIPDTALRRLILQPSLSNDGLHPNARGEEMMAETVARHLERFLPDLRH